MSPVAVTAVLAASCGTVAALLVLVRRVEVDAPELDEETVRRTVRGHPALARWLRRRPPPAPLTAAALVPVATAGVLVASFLGVVLLMVSTEQGLARSDLPLARWARDHSSDGASDLLGSLSKLGGTEVVLLVGALLAIVGVRRANGAHAVAFVAMTVLGQFAIVNVIKWLIDRARPDLAQLTGYAGASFPSGHAAAAAATWACAALILGFGRTRAVRALLAGTGVAIATAVAATRVFLGVHWFTDVLAGLALGWGWFAICSLAFGGRNLHFGQPLDRAEDESARVSSSRSIRPRGRAA